eukprot:XP_011674504.1 PREDICTED: melatonin receptor type 1A-like [Strongylocentrotus purpuratus]
MADESTLSTSAFDLTNGSLPGGYYGYQSLGVAQRVVLFIILLIISITGIIGNSIVILAIVLSRKLRSTFNWFVLNLACADLLTSICLPFYIAISQFDWAFKLLVCFMCACVGVSLTTHAFLGFTSWYRVTKNQEKFKKLYKARNLCLMIAFTWLFNFASVYLIVRLNEEVAVFVIPFWYFGHFAIIVTVYIKIWRFIAHGGEKLKPKKKVDGKIQNEIRMDTICSDKNQVTQQGGLVIENTVLRVSHSSEHLGSQNCDISKGERLKSGQPENHTHDAETLTVSPSLEEIESTGGGPDLRSKEVPVRVEGSETKVPVKKQTQPKIDKKLLAVTKNLLLSTNYPRIRVIPTVITDCPPLTFMEDLNPAFG